MTNWRIDVSLCLVVAVVVVSCAIAGKHTSGSSWENFLFCAPSFYENSSMENSKNENNNNKNNNKKATAVGRSEHTRRDEASWGEMFSKPEQQQQQRLRLTADLLFAWGEQALVWECLCEWLCVSEWVSGCSVCVSQLWVSCAWAVPEREERRAESGSTADVPLTVYVCVHVCVCVCLLVCCNTYYICLYIFGGLFCLNELVGETLMKTL